MAFYNRIDDRSNFVISFSVNPQQDFGVFAKGYSKAASVLAESLLEKNRFSDYEAYPVVFLYRHAFELYLKAFYYKAALIAAFKNIQVTENFPHHHRLTPLAQLFKKICQLLFPSDKSLLQFADNINRFAAEFEQIDFDSSVYRYPTDRKGNASRGYPQLCNLFSFHQDMEELFNELEVIDFGLDVEASQAEEIYEILQEAQSMIASANDEHS